MCAFSTGLTEKGNCIIYSEPLVIIWVTPGKSILEWSGGIVTLIQKTLIESLSLPILFYVENQKFNYTWLRLIQHEDSCLTLIDAEGTLGLHPCDKRNNSQKWLHKSLVAFHPELVSAAV